MKTHKNWKTIKRNGKDEFRWNYDPAEERPDRIENENFEKIVFDKMNFDRMYFSRCTFTDCLFEKCDFSDSGFQLCRFEGTRIIKSKMKETRIYTSCLIGAELINVNMNRACLGQTTFFGFKITDSYLYAATLSNIMFNNGEIVNTNIEEIRIDEGAITRVKGVNYASVSFPWHGERGRTLLELEDGNATRYHCGCFSGTEAELWEYIGNDEARLVRSRSLALETVKMLLREGRKNGKTRLNV
jgi:uncharacterized protein YjbI with pentapeptide repeats